jgi:lipopolysaccharide/colanic/teichoic acid biosynthesis glycosyltransferase
MNAVNPAAAVGHEPTVELPAVPGVQPVVATPGALAAEQVDHRAPQTIPSQRQPSVDIGRPPDIGAPNNGQPNNGQPYTGQTSGVPASTGQSDHGQSVHGQSDNGRAATTAVLPYGRSRASRVTGWIRAWMITAPVDLAAMLSPLLITIQYWRGTLVAAGLTIGSFIVGGLYRPRRHVSILDQLPSLAGRLLVAVAVVAVISAMRHDSVDNMVNFVRTLALAAGLVLVGRVITTRLTVFARRRRWVEHTTLIVGTGPVALELARLLRRYPQYGLRFVGWVDSGSRTGPEVPPLAGTLADLEAVIAMTRCEVLVIADTDYPESALMEVLARPGCARCDLWAVPLMWGTGSQGRVPDDIGAIPVVHIRHTTLSGPRWLVKRLSDILFATVAIVVLSPLLLLCALATWMDGGRGIFFRQVRIGRHGRPFKLVKFRTMRPADEHESQTHWSIANDPRIGPVGRFMRRSSLDELPQLWNILRGDTPISDRARFDNYYIENWSLWLDIKVAVRTVAEVLRGGGR